ncbi:hypothetical protein QEG98_38095 [Myxococcus sp. MxC21-1]|uniref:hypothetical protein n=1 Tax=Myxococcus sp. MxC21-1 TaxID=3041439 RepID=UPI0029311264|nr:hypothetical protein [Myxococcus sp. MxC21-1]WNZ61613.1 hypothetical protein QEG98_38095 [Myxococcus sp. MxC21-1]
MPLQLKPGARLLALSALLLVSPAVNAQSYSNARPRAVVPYKQLPNRDVQVGDSSGASRSALPARGAFCKSVKGLLGAASNGFVSLRGAAERNSTDEVSIWKSKQGPQDFRCFVYRTRTLGDYVYCVQSNLECGTQQDSFHVYSAYLMDSCKPTWSWNDSRVHSYDPRRMVTGTSEEGIRIVLEMSRSKVSYSTCDLTLSIELL